MKELCTHYRRNLFRIRKYTRRRQFEKVKEIQRENFYIKLQIDKYINDIDDCVTKLIFRERVLQGRGWLGVASALGGRNTADGVRKRFMRQFEKKIEKSIDI